MDRLIQILSFSCLIFLVCTFDLQHDFSSDDGQYNRVYDIESLARKSLLHFQNSYRFKNQFEQPQFEPVFKNLTPERLEFYSRNSTKCFHDLIYVAENLNGISGQWAIKMLDSYGKPDSGILEGSMKWLGEYTECTQVYAPAKHNSTTGNFHGQYCSLGWSINISNFSLAITSGVCLPDTCSASEIKGSAKLLYPIVDFLGLNGTVNVTSFICSPTEKKLNAAAKVVIALMSLFCALVILGSSVTAVKYFMESANASSRRSSFTVNVPPSDWVGDQSGTHKRNADSDDELLLGYESPQVNLYGFLKKGEPFLECFCIFRNGAKLLNTAGGEGELLCIHGIRFLSMSWVILGHIYSFSFSITRNIIETVELAKGFPFQIVLQGFFSVDSFFCFKWFPSDLPFLA